MHDTDGHYFDVRQVQDMRMEYIQKRQRFIFTCMIGGWNMYEKRQHFIFTRTIGGWNMYEKTVSGRHFNKIRRNES